MQEYYKIYLQSLNLSNKLQNQVVDKFKEFGQIITVPKGTLIAKYRQRPESLYILIKGSALILYPKSQEQILMEQKQFLLGSARPQNGDNTKFKAIYKLLEQLQITQLVNYLHNHIFDGPILKFDSSSPLQINQYIIDEAKPYPFSVVCNSDCYFFTINFSIIEQIIELHKKQKQNVIETLMIRVFDEGVRNIELKRILQELIKHCQIKNVSVHFQLYSYQSLSEYIYLIIKGEFQVLSSHEIVESKRDEENQYSKFKKLLRKEKLKIDYKNILEYKKSKEIPILKFSTGQIVGDEDFTHDFINPTYHRFKCECISAKGKVLAIKKSELYKICVFNDWFAKLFHKKCEFKRNWLIQRYHIQSQNDLKTISPPKVVQRSQEIQFEDLVSRVARRKRVLKKLLDNNNKSSYINNDIGLMDLMIKLDKSKKLLLQHAINRAIPPNLQPKNLYCQTSQIMFFINQLMNYKLYLRIRPIDFEQSMIVLKDNQISIKDPTNKQAEYQNFKFDNVFDKNATQQKLFDQVLDYDYMNQNSCILSYGQSGSGKSFSIFGTLQSPGLLPLLVMKLFKMNCKLAASFQEVYIDQVKDLHTDLITEEFTKKEINNIGELWEIIKVVQKTDIKRQVRTHILFTLEINNNYKVQFVDLAGSERVAKNLTEGSKYQEAIMINSSHTTLGRCLTILNQNSQKLLPTNESKLTKYLMLQPTTYISLIGNINPSESNYEECLATLQFMDRTKNIQLNIKKSASMADDKTFQIQLEKQIKRLMDENEALKQKIDQMALERKKKFSDLQKILGLDIDLEKLSNKTAKDITQFRIQQEALVKAQQLESQMDEKIQEIFELKRQIKTLEQDSHQKIERLTSTLFEQKELQKKLKEQLSAQKINSDDTVRQLTAEKEQVVKRMIENSNNLLEEKISSILSLPQFAQTKSVENQKLQEVRKASKLEAEKDFKIALEQIRQEQQRLMNACKTQYEYFLNEKNNEIEKFLAQFKDYRMKKKTQIKELQEELLDLFDICTKQAKVIEKIENGGYSAGIKSFSIPKQDKPNLPIRSKHKNLFKCIDNRSTSLTLTKKNTINEKTIRNTPKNIRQSQTQKDYITDILDTAQLDQLNFHMMDLSTLRNYAIKLRDMIKEQQDQFTQVQDKLKNQIASALKERDEIQTKYNVESRKYNSTRVVIESQNRLLSKVRPLSSVQRKS